MPSLFHSPPPSVMRDHAPLISALITQGVEPPLQNLAVNPPPLPQFLALPLQQDVPPLQPSALRAAASPPISILLQGRGEPPLISQTVRTYAPLLYAFLLWKDAPICQPLYETAPLPQL